MNFTYERIRALIASEDWRASDHALQRLTEYVILASDLADGILESVFVEDYPDFHAGPCVLLLQADRGGPVHAVWGLESGSDRPAVLVTVYRPSSARWNDDLRTRKL